jgi:hypothetical protein
VVRVLVLVVGVACGGSQRPQASSASIVVVDAGAAPRQRLRFEASAHAPERIEVQLKLRTRNAFENTMLQEGQRSLDFPTVRVIERLEASAVDSLGNADVSSDVEAASVLDDVVDPAPRRLLEPEIAKLTGLHASWRRAPSGAMSNMVVETDVRRSMQAKTIVDAIRDTSVMFPDAEIGVGATWTVTSQQFFAGVMWDRTVKFTLTALDGPTATVIGEFAMHASPQALGVEPNATTKLTSGTLTATADLTIPLHGLAVTGTMRGTSEVNLVIVRGHLRITSTIQTEISSSVEVKPP